MASSEQVASPDLVPARMLNEFTYCPRLGYLMWVDAEFADSVDTVDGRFRHRRVDKPGGSVELPEEDAAKSRGDGDQGDGEEKGPEGEPFPRQHARSVMLSAPGLGMIARLDLLEAAGPSATPVDYKRGEKPDRPEGPWEPERVQLCAQGLILEENGFSCSGGVLYYVASKARVEVPFTEALRTRTQELLVEFRRVADAGVIPPPLVDSPKCPRCSLVGICLPDELNLLQRLARDEQTSIGGVVPGPAELSGTAEPVDRTDQLDGAIIAARAVRAAVEADAAADADDDIPEPSGGAAPPLRSEPTPPGEDRVRRLIPARDDALPIYVQEQGARIGKTGDRLRIDSRNGESWEVRLLETSQVCVFGNVQVTTQAVHELINAAIPLAYFSYGGYFIGMTRGLPHKNVELRRRQYALAAEPPRCLELARAFVAGKIRNCRTLLRRNGDSGLEPAVLKGLKQDVKAAEQAESIESLLGIEGNAARRYFGAFPHMLKVQDASFMPEGRNRRPPKDPVNALLSFGYALLTKELTVTLDRIGFDPLLGMYHQPRYGKPALALDLMEEFRPLIVDSVVISTLNTREIAASDFVRATGAVNLKPDARKRFLQAWERRLDGLVTHPIFGYRCTYRRVLEVQARLLARTVLGEIPGYPSFCTR